MYTPEEVTVHHYFRTYRVAELLGYVPHNNDCWLYYAYPIQGTEHYDEPNYVTSAFGTYEHIQSDEEDWYLRDISSVPGLRHSNVEHHEKNCQYHRGRVQTHRYIVFFMGADDGDMMMRFKDKEEALLYLNAADCFEDLVQMREMLRV